MDKEEFRGRCRHNLKRSVEHRIKYGFVRDESYPKRLKRNRGVKAMEEYREWPIANFPKHLGFKIIGRDGHTLENSTYRPLEWKGDVDEPED